MTRTRYSALAAHAVCARRRGGMRVRHERPASVAQGCGAGDACRDMPDPMRGPRPEDVTVAALFSLPYAAYLVVLQAVRPATELQWTLADPILVLSPRAATPWLSVVAALALAALWWKLAPPDRQALRRGAIGAIAGALLAALAWGALRLAVGETLPAFIPREESAGPGFLLSMTAGVEEEQLCRLALVPALFFPLRRRGVWRAAAVAVLASGLVFAVWHAAGEATFAPVYFATRLLGPGCVMSLVWLVSPPAIVVDHLTAHLFIPALFVAA